MSTLSVAFTALSGLGGLAGIAAFFNVVIQRKRINAEARKIGVDADVVMSDQALKMYELARAEAQEAKQEARECRQRQIALEDHVDRLERIMRDAHLEPPPFQYPVLTIQPPHTASGEA